MPKSPRRSPQERLISQRRSRITRGLIGSNVEMDSVGRALRELGLEELSATAHGLAAAIDNLLSRVTKSPVAAPAAAELRGAFHDGVLEGLELEAGDVIDLLLADGSWLRGRFGHFLREGTATVFDWAFRVRFPSSKAGFVEVVMARPFRAFARLVDQPGGTHPGEPSDRTSIEWRGYDHFFENEELQEGEPLEVFMEDGRWLRGVYGKERERHYGVALLKIHFGRGTLGEDARVDDEHWLPIPAGAYVRRTR